MDKEVWIYSMASTVSWFNFVLFFLVGLHKKYCLQNSADICRRHEKSNN